MPVTTVTATIPAGQSLSNAVDCTAGATNASIVSIMLPAAWNVAGGLSLQTSIDNAVFYDLFGPDGHELLITVTPNSAINIPVNWAKSITWLKLRAGTRERPVNQNEARNFIIVLAS